MPARSTRAAGLALTLVATLVLGPRFLDAAIFVRIPGVPGDVTAAGYDDGSWFEARSGSYGTERDLAASAGGGTADINIGIAELLPIGLVCDLNQAAAPLLQASVDGNLVGNVEIHLVDLVPEPSTFAIIKLTRAHVKAFATATPANERPWYQAFLVYQAIEVTNRLANPPAQGGVSEQTTTWNLVTNTGGYRETGTTNQAPTISPLSPVSLSEDGTRGVPFTVADPDGPAASLTTTATSSNQTLLPNDRIGTSGAGSSRSLTLNPAPNRHGTATVTVVVSDAFASVSTAFVVTVTPAADPPAISDIKAQVTDADSAVTLALAAADPDQDAATLRLTATATNRTLVPDANISFAHDGTSWQMTITPAAGMAGSTDVTVVVIDDTGNRASASFLFTVNSASNSAPTDILIAPGVVAENSPAGALVGTLRAIDPDDDSEIVFELVGDAGGRFELAGGNEIVSTSPAVLDFEADPSHGILVRATDPDGAVFAKALVVQVANVNEPPEVTINLPPSLPATTPGAPSPLPIPFLDIGLFDPDSGAADVRVTFEVIHGILHLDDSGVLSGKLTTNNARGIGVVAPIADILVVLADGGFTYLPDPGYEGADSLAIAIHDNGNSGSGSPLGASASEPFFLRPEPVLAWLAGFFSPEELADPAVGGILADFDRDGVAALLEFKLGKNPRNPGDAGTDIETGEILIDDQAYFQLAFVQRTDETTPNTTLIVEAADDFSGWRSGEEVVTVVSRTPLGNDLERVVLRLVASRAEQPRQFLRFSARHFGFAAPVNP